PLSREVFTSQADAESWLGENWRELLDQGVEQVTLLNEDRVEYRGMSLRQEGRPRKTGEPLELPGTRGSRASGALLGAHRLGAVALHDRAEHVVDALHHVGVELDARRLHVVAHLLRPAGADDRAGAVRV